MGGASSFLAMLSITGFLSAAWFATRISKFFGISSIVLEITTGLLLGPGVLGLVMPEYAECQHGKYIDCSPPSNLQQLIVEGKPLGEGLGMVAHMGLCDPHDYEHHTNKHHTDNVTVGDIHAGEGHAGGHRRLSGGGSFDSYDECLVKSCEAEVSTRCQMTPDFFTLIGHTGVAMMIFESGMHFDFEKAAKVGPKACAVAVLGTILPFLSGATLTWIYGRPFMRDGMAVGTALAPTSVGIALRLLNEAKVLQEDFGQAIITAAFVDDILSLILFNVIFSLTGEFHFVPVVVYPIIGIAFMIAAMFAAVYTWPVLINEKILPRFSEDDSKISRRDEVLFLIMMVVLVAYATFTHFLGTHLWGCFMAGMSFACLGGHHAHHVWVTQTKRATSWMIRIFFAATVAFSIPIQQLFSLDAFWKGTLMGLGPCIATKVVCALFMGAPKWVIGWAMVGRAEFAYLIAQMAASANMMDQATFSIVIWALLYATIFAPFIFRKMLNKYVAEHCAAAVQKQVTEESEAKAKGVISPDQIYIVDPFDRN
jgi:Kef-type K+ transport system membrane component KefB